MCFVAWIVPPGSHQCEETTLLAYVSINIFLMLPLLFQLFTAFFMMFLDLAVNIVVFI